MRFTVPSGGTPRRLREFNPCHRPPGEGGGQFAAKGEGNCYGGFHYAPDPYFVSQTEAQWDDHLRGMSAEEKRERKALVSKHAQMLVDKAKVVVRLPPDVLALVADDGRLKSQHESGESRGLFDPAQRTKTEDTIFGEYDDVRDRPIYGLMMESVDTEASRDAMSDATTSTQYGTAIVVLKESIRARTTMLFGDSLMTEQVLRGVPTPITEMSHLAVPATAALKSTTYWERPVTGLTSVDQFTMVYPEAQIHGGVSLDDIDRIVISSAEVTPEVRRALRRLEEAGVTIRVLKRRQPITNWRTVDTRA